MNSFNHAEHALMTLYCFGVWTLFVIAVVMTASGSDPVGWVGELAASAWKRVLEKLRIK